MNYTYEINELSSDFYSTYNRDQYPEILCKENRPYTVFLIEYREDVFIAVPFRTNIRHKNSYIFTNNYIGDISGLDYSKIVIIKNPEYIGVNTTIDSNEFSELIQNSHIIVKQVISYVETYCKHIKGIKTLDDKTFSRNYKYTTLKYFHNELGLS